MKTKPLSTLLRSKPVLIPVDLVKLLPDNKAIIGMYEEKRDFVTLGIVKIANRKTISVLRSAWRNKRPSVEVWRDKGGKFPVCRA